MGFARFVPQLAFCLLLVGPLGCDSRYVKAYRAAHPDWHALSFPSLGSDLPELLAGLYAPRTSPESYGDSTTVSSVRIFDATESRWTEIETDRITSFEFGGEPDRTYLAAVKLSCASTGPNYHRVGSKLSWYLLEGNRLTSYSDVVYQMYCYGSERVHVRPGLPDDYVGCLSQFPARLVMRGVDLEEDACGPAPPVSP